MKKELIEFIHRNYLSPFSETKSQTSRKEKSIFKTPEARNVYRKIISAISKNFIFSETQNLFNSFEFSFNEEEIKRRQEFFKKVSSMGKKDNSFLKQLEKPRKKWTPDYDIVVVTENSETFNELKNRGYPAQLVISEADITTLQERDIVQVIDSDEYTMTLESLPQSIFLDSIDEVYLEKQLENLSGWDKNLQVLKENQIGGEIGQIVEELYPLLNLTKDSDSSKLTYDGVKSKIDEINEKINTRAKELSVSGDSLVGILNKGELPEEIKNIVYDEIRNSEIPESIINVEVPLSIDEQALEEEINKQESEENTKVAEKIKEKSEELKKVEYKLERLSSLLLVYDFIAGVSDFISIRKKENIQKIFPEISEGLTINNSLNPLLEISLQSEELQPISFYLNNEEKCSILTGANSGGKTTLIEHLIQVISLEQIGLPISGEEIKIPLFNEVYYFAKNNGAISRGAFENLLDQMSKINPSSENGNKTLILADEIESVTEPGVAGNIISATAEYFLKQNCFLVIATHLGYEIKPNLPEKARIDGIEAKGLDKNFNLIVDHNPVKGRLANSTPELIVERLANNEKKDYYVFLNEHMKRNKNYSLNQ